MAAQDISGLLSTLKTSLESALEATPDASLLAPTTNGISLFDTKNEIFLGYLQNLVFLILFKIRQLKDGSSDGDTDESQKKIWDGTVENLVKLRVYADKGVRPIEGRLRYEIDRVVQAAQDAANASNQQSNGTKKDSKSGKRKKQKQKHINENGFEDEDEDENSASAEASGSEDESDDDEELDAPAFKPEPRPNLANFRLPGQPSPYGTNSPLGKPSDRSRGGDSAPASSSTGAYRPPRVAPTSMPTTTPAERRARQATGGRVRSEALNEYIAEELSGAPTAQPSVGSNIERAGRAVQTAAQRRVADERRAYEEANFVRLPAAGKKERQRAAAGAGGGRDAMRNGFGGEDWRDLGAGAERVMRELDQRKKGSSALERSRKRGPEELGIGGGGGGKSSFEKRRKTLQKRARR